MVWYLRPIDMQSSWCCLHFMSVLAVFWRFSWLIKDYQWVIYDSTTDNYVRVLELRTNCFVHYDSKCTMMTNLRCCYNCFCVLPRGSLGIPCNQPRAVSFYFRKYQLFVTIEIRCEICLFIRTNLCEDRVLSKLQQRTRTIGEKNEGEKQCVKFATLCRSFHSPSAHRWFIGLHDSLVGLILPGCPIRSRGLT